MNQLLTDNEREVLQQVAAALGTSERQLIEDLVVKHVYELRRRLEVLTEAGIEAQSWTLISRLGPRKDQDSSPLGD